MSDRSAVEILSDVVSQFTVLIRKEGQLARTEFSEKISQAAVGVGLVVAGAVFLMPALVILLQAGVAALVKVVPEPWTSLIVGGGALLLGLLIALIGVSLLKAKNLTPEHTIHQLRRDAAVAKQQMRESNENQRAA